MADSPDQIAIFPLAVVLLPGTVLPLHIFEERYREMVQECLEDSVPFGVVFASSRSMEHSGCTARIQTVLRNYEDGRSDILTIGERRFTISDLDDSEPLLRGTVDYFEDESTDSDDGLDDAARMAIEDLMTLARQSGREINEEQLLRLPPRALSFVLAGSDILPAREKQRCLDSRRALERFECIRENLNEALERQKGREALRRALGDDIDLDSMMN